MLIFVSFMQIRLSIILIKHLLFWMLFFVLSRSVFVIYNFSRIKSEGLMEILRSYVHGAYLDLSATSYLMAIPFLLLLAWTLSRSNVLLIINTWFHYLFIFICSLIAITELSLYDEWGTKMSMKALSYLAHPDEVIKSAGNKIMFLGLLATFLLTIFSGWVYSKYVKPNKLFPPPRKWSLIITTLVTPIILVLMLRGGWQQIPINQSDVYYSSNNLLNLSAVNSFWNLGHSIEQNKSYMDTNPYDYYPLNEAKKEVEILFAEPDTATEKILTTDKPNVVLIILESWSADLMKSLGGYDSIAPNMEMLASQGVLFTNAYGPGERSDQGMAAIFSAFPAQPTTSIIKQPSKFQKLPCINTQIKKAGYASSFYFGGQLNYGNIKGYMYYNQFDKIMEGVDFPSSIPRGKLTVHDEYLFAQQLSDLKQEKQPFFSAMFTGSTHSPFDMPMKEAIDWGGEYQGYLNSAFYTDKCLGEYFVQAKKQSWYSNTLFIIVADHAHPSPREWEYYHPLRKKIPMMFFGDVIKPEYRGYKYEKLASQVDIAKTLLHQLDLDASPFKWSRDLFKSGGEEFAYYTFIDGVGWIRKNEYYVWHHQLKRVFYQVADSEASALKMEKESKSFLQVLFDEYLQY